MDAFRIDRQPGLLSSPMTSEFPGQLESSPFNLVPGSASVPYGGSSTHIIGHDGYNLPFFVPSKFSLIAVDSIDGDYTLTLLMRRRGGPSGQSGRPASNQRGPK
jgi:hypothetical protein